MKWYVITLPFHDFEKRVQRGIEKACYRIHRHSRDVVFFYPVIARYDRGQVIQEPLYEGYAFLGLLDDVDEWFFFLEFDDFTSSMVVLREIVRRRPSPEAALVDVAIPDAVVEEIIESARRRCATLTIQRTVQRASQTIFEGDLVHIREGVFEGYTGIVRVVDQVKREVATLIYFMGTDVVIYEKIDHVERVPLQSSRRIHE
jgi:transcription antitermination factor NusG